MSYKLSIIIPTYKRTISLSRLINLLKEQTIIKDIQIIIVDQNEKEYLTREIGKSVLMGIQHLYQNEPNVSSARNLGAKYSSARFILFLDDDVLPQADFCERGILILEGNENIKILSPTLLRKEQKVKEVLPKKVKSNLFVLTSKEKYLHASFFTISACTFYDRATFFNSGGFDPYLFRFGKTAEDQEYFIRLIKKKFAVHLSTNFTMLIDEDVSGGCELRTSDYWVTREKCVKAWAYRYRVHNNNLGKLKAKDIIALCRHTFLNSSLFSRSIKNSFKQVKLLYAAINESKIFIETLLLQNLVNNKLNYIKTD